MDKKTRSNYETLWSDDGEARYQAMLEILEETERPVDWAYEVWDDLLQKLADKDNHVRAIAAQMLCNLSRSDPEKRMLGDFPRLLAVTKDERFVTARHCLQAIWKVGTAGKEQQEMVVAGLSGRFFECASEKNCTLIRSDIIQCLKDLYRQVGDEAVQTEALRLIEAEPDEKYRKKYSSIWRAKR